MWALGYCRGNTTKQGYAGQKGCGNKHSVWARHGEYTTATHNTTCNIMQGLQPWLLQQSGLQTAAVRQHC
jgi:hypothetical protein